MTFPYDPRERIPRARKERGTVFFTVVLAGLFVAAVAIVMIYTGLRTG